MPAERDQPTSRGRRGEGSKPVYVERRHAFRVRPPRAPGARWQTDIWIRATGPDDETAYAEASKILRRELHRRETGGAARLDRSTKVGRWTRRYVDELATGLRGQSRKTYAATAGHIERELGHLRLAELKASDVAAMMTRLESRGLTANRRYGVLSLLRLALRAAIADERLTRNVAELVDAPKRTQRLTRPPSPDLVRTILERVLDDPVVGAAYAVTVATGCREGEALALRWSDVIGGSVIFESTLSQRSGARLDPKSETSRRVLPLAPFAIAALERRRAWQLADGSSGSEGLIFTVPSKTDPRYRAFKRPAGAELRGHYLLRHLHGVCDELGVPRLRWHDFRHEAATRMLARTGDVSRVQKALGHATIATTARYLHTDGDLADALDPFAEPQRAAR